MALNKICGVERITRFHFQENVFVDGCSSAGVMCHPTIFTFFDTLSFKMEIGVHRY